MINTPLNCSVETENVQSSNFTIKATGKGFKFIAAQIYSDPVRACLAELGQNCADSHIMAGKPTEPFIVKLPNILEPHIEFKDFGVGMSHEFMMTRYTNLFDSTKDMSNDCSGAYGVGKLVGFAINDNYTVICREGGIERIYSIHYNSKSEPVASLLGEQATHEPNGVTVRVEIPMNRVSDFQNKAKEVFRWYKTKPLIQGVDDFHFNEHNYTLVSQSGEWGLTKNQYSFAIMGVYGYRIDPDSIPEISDGHRTILESGLLAEFPMGQLEVAGSREHLSYDQRTVQNLKNFLDKVAAELIAETKANVANAKSRWEAVSIYNTVVCGNMRDLLQDQTYVWQGEEIKNGQIDFNAATHTFNPLLEYFYDGRKRRRNSGTPRLRKAHISALHPGKEDYVFIYNDGITKRGEVNYKILNIWDTSKKFVLMTFNNILDMQAFSDYYFGGNLEFKKLSELETDPEYFVKKAATKAYIQNYDRRSGVRALTYNGGSDYKDINNWDAAQMDIKNGSGCYVLVEKFAYLKGLGTYGSSSSQYLENISKIVKKYGIDTIYGVKITHKDKVGPGWKTLQDRVAEIVNKYLSDPANVKKIEDYNACYHVKLSHFNELEPRLNKNGDLYKYIQFVRASQQDAHEIDEIKMMTNWAGVSGANNSTPILDVEGKYPLFSPTAGYDNLEAVIEYLNFIDAKSNAELEYYI